VEYTDVNTGNALLAKHQLHHCRNDLIFKTQNFAVLYCRASSTVMGVHALPSSQLFLLAGPVMVCRCWQARALQCRCFPSPSEENCMLQQEKFMFRLV